jgi:hypothetical protein
MPKTGDSFIVTLGPSHLGWGRYRHTKSRPQISGEGFLPIPARYAKAMNITNSNGVDNTLYNCNSSDGNLKNVTLLAQGGSKAGYKYAKNFAGKGNLKLLGTWFTSIGAKIGDKIEIKFTSPTDILLTKL